MKYTKNGKMHQIPDAPPPTLEDRIKRLEDQL